MKTITTHTIELTGTHYEAGYHLGTWMSVTTQTYLYGRIPGTGGKGDGNGSRPVLQLLPRPQ